MSNPLRTTSDSHIWDIELMAICHVAVQVLFYESFEPKIARIDQGT